MRVLLTTPLYPPDTGGAAIYFSQISHYLEKKKQIRRVVVLTKAEKGLPVWERNRETIIIIRMIKFSRVPPLNFATVFLPTFICSLLFKIDIAHIHASLLLKGACLALRCLRVPFIIDVRDRLGGAALAPYGNLVGYCSLNIRSDLENLGVKSHVYLPIPVDVERLDDKLVQRLQKRLQIRSPYILYVGDITAEKGVWELVQSFEIFHQSHPDYCLVLVGRNHEEIDFSCFEMVRYLGELPHDVTTALMQGSELIVLPSKNEGLPRVCLEGFALQKRVICPPNVPEFQTHCKDFVLSEIRSDTILSKLEAVVASSAIPKYPISNHNLVRALEQLFDLYNYLMKVKTN